MVPTAPSLQRLAEKSALPTCLTQFWRPACSWPLALVAGFIAQLLLIFFVTSLGLSELEATDTRLRTLVEQHMASLQLTKTMQVAVRERTVSLARMINIHDAFEHDAEQQRFRRYADTFITARRHILELPLSGQEQALLDQQWQLTLKAMPLQNEVIDLSLAGHTQEAQRVLTQAAIPTQDAVMKALSQLDDMIRSGANVALQDANRAHEEARRWMLLLSGAALFLGMLIASVVVRNIHRVNAERERLATHDPLTGLPNRTLLMDRIEQAILRAKRNRSHAGLLFIDLDGFKAVNDSLGHAVGDELLKIMATRLKQVIRAVDIVARLGGDEFIVGVLDATSREQIEHVSEKLLDVISRPCSLAGRDIILSGSVGVCIYPEDGADAKSLLKCADFAMYAAKQAGKNRVRHFTPDLGRARPFHGQADSRFRPPEAPLPH